MLKYDFLKYDKYAFEKYEVFENTNTFLWNTTGQRANTLIFAINRPCIGIHKKYANSLTNIITEKSILLSSISITVQAYLCKRKYAHACHSGRNYSKVEL